MIFDVVRRTDFLKWGLRGFVWVNLRELRTAERWRAGQDLQVEVILIAQSGAAVR